MNHSFVSVSIVAILAASGIAQAADTKIDVASANAAIPAVIRASTDTPISYPGGTPPTNILGSYDAQDSTFNRTLSDCVSISAVGTAVPYDTITLTNSGAANATLNLRIGNQGDPTGVCSGAIDTFIALYDSTFNPASPALNCLQANDDFTGGGLCSGFTNVSVPAGATRVIVLTTFDNGAAFPYEVTFGGTTPVSLQSFKID